MIGRRVRAPARVSSEQHCYAGLDFELKRSSRRRRTLSLVVKNKTKVVVMAPWRTSLQEVYKLLNNKQNWLQQQLQIGEQSLAQIAQGYAGDVVWYLGQPRSIVFKAADRNALDLQENEFVIEYKGGAQPQHPVVLKKIKQRLRSDANLLLPQRLKKWAVIMSLHPAGVQVKQYKARWGSCSSRGVIQLNWRLIGAPQAVIDYVLVHELAHLNYFNHSAPFWGLVEATLPEFKVQRNWLRDNGNQLIV